MSALDEADQRSPRGLRTSGEQVSLSQAKALAGTPSGYFVVVPGSSGESTIDLVKIGSILRASWKLWLTTMLLAAIATAGISLRMRNVYRAQVLVAPVVQTGGSGALREQLGGLAALAGIDMGAASGHKEEAYATLSSAGLARNFIVTNNLMPVLFADRWDAKAAQWRPGAAPPTLEAGVRKFSKSVLLIKQDRLTGLVSVAAEWYSPQLAAQWANQMVAMANERIRTDATRNAEQSVEYLNKELAKTTVVELRQAIYRLIQEQVNNAMFANVQREYAFRVIDPAVPPDVKAAPARALMVIGAAFAGLLFGFLLVFVRRAMREAAARQ